VAAGGGGGGAAAEEEEEEGEARHAHDLAANRHCPPDWAAEKGRGEWVPALDGAAKEPRNHQKSPVKEPC